MYAGRIVEQGTVHQVIETPRHPYTRGLMESIPSRGVRGQPLLQIPGVPPSPLRLPQGCAFRDRCSRASDACLAEPDISATEDGHQFLCFHPLQPWEHQAALGAKEGFKATP
jgi:peptide/nickel transport system ATP-binding protein